MINDTTSISLIVTSNITSSLLYWLGIINPILSFICMVITAIGGIYYILVKRKEYYSKQ